MNRDYWQLKAAAANYYDAHRLCTRMGNRLGALHRHNLHDPRLEHQLEAAKESRTVAARDLRLLYREVAPPAIVKFQKETIGLGDLLVAQLVGVVGDFKVYTEAWWEKQEDDSPTTPDSQVRRDLNGSHDTADSHDNPVEKRVLVTGETKTAGVRDIWTYCGHGNVESRRRRGAPQEDQFKAGNPLAKMITHEIADFALRQNGEPDKNGKGRPMTPYYWRYIERKAQTAVAHPEWSKKRRDNDAKRIVGKAMLKDIWRVQHGFEPAYGKRTPWTDATAGGAASRLLTAANEVQP